MVLTPSKKIVLSVLLFVSTLSPVSPQQDVLLVTVTVESGSSPSLAVIVLEGQTLRLCFTPDVPPSSESTVFVSSENGTAAEPSDYQSIAETLTFITGSSSSQCVDVQIADDGMEETMEDFMVIGEGLTGDYGDYVSVVLVTIDGTIAVQECPVLLAPVGGSVIVTGVTPGNVAIYSCNDGLQLSGDVIRTCLPTGEWTGEEPVCVAGDCEVLEDPMNGMVTVDGLSVGSTATYECDPGFILIGSEQRFCQEDGIWSGTPAICIFVDCGGLDDPTNGQVSLNGTAFESIATYTCDPGFSLIGDIERTCQENGNWSGSEPTCEDIIDCGELGDPNNGQVSLNGTIIGSIATYTCDTGFNLIGDMERICQENGEWSGNEPTCEVIIIDCGELDDPNNGQVSLNGTTLGSIATYTCDPGHSLIGDMERICQENGTWSGNEPTCEVNCGDLDDPTNGQVVLNGTLFGSIATYTCNPGFILIGDVERICQANGEWSGTEPTCEVDCGDLPDPNNGQVSLNGTAVGSIATYTCDAGYNLIGNVQRMCQGNGSWSGDEPVCQIVDCGSLDNPNNGRVSLNDTTFWSTATYTCDPGFNLIGNMERICQANGAWSGDEPTCEVAVCGFLPDPENGSVTISGPMLGSTATYSCDTGYDLIGNMERVCQENGTWSGNQPVCQIVDCGDLDDPTNGQVLLNGITFGSTATYTCDPGFILTGAMERICQANGNWSGNEPTCEVNCGDLNDPNNGQVSLNGTILGSIATYTCDPGFNLTGDMERTCQANGDWSGSEPVCQIVDCGDLDDPNNGQVSLNGTTFGSLATYTCDTGYDLIGDVQRVCQASGNWSGNEPVCQIVECGDLDDPNNGQVSLNGTIFGSTATYTCDPGFNLIGDMERICQANGNWSGSEPVCQIVDCGELDNPNNGQVSLDGIIFGSIATYTCDTGFNLIGDMERICQANGNWSESEPVCQIVDCGDLDDPINGQVSLSGTTFESIATYTCDPGFTLTRGVERTCRENGQWSGNEPFCALQSTLVILGFTSESVSVIEGDTSVSVCFGLLENSSVLTETLRVGISTRDNNAIAGEDYEETSVSLILSAGLSAGNSSCFPVTILNDVIVEDRETFSVVLNHVVLVSSGVIRSTYFVMRHRTDVSIMDSNFFTFTANTPMVNGNSITLTFEPTEGIVSATCSVPTQPPQDCTSGSAFFPNLRLIRVLPYRVTIDIVLPDGRNTSLMRLVRTETTAICSANLINSGITVTPEGQVTIDWQPIGPSPELRIEDNQMQCTLFHLDTGEMTFHPSCPSPPFTTAELPNGNYEFLVRPNPTTDSICRRRIGLRVQFTIS